ncbi:hypothetical protein P43SY_005911 [Pythium insidiosum]|uniref:Uncharacterized protein n=1 Tax=Pythium insidiosum TaxID=114742 RepID=A0AAD5M3G4_PYTIN|nr:hypothetical protein P43SY_005911 [Pythium insidiosum]
MNASHSGLVVQIGYLETASPVVDLRDTNVDTEKGTASKKLQDQQQDRSMTNENGFQPNNKSARKQNIPVRSGKWNVQEENYLRKLVQLFSAGVLDEKQMHGENFKGKVKFQKDLDRIEHMSQIEYDKICHDVQRLRTSFLKHWAKEEFGRWNLIQFCLFSGELVAAMVAGPNAAQFLRQRLHFVDCAPLIQEHSIQPCLDIVFLFKIRVANDCKTLVDENVLNARSDEAQRALCSNSCFATINNKYKVLLDNNCYDSSDKLEASSGSLQAAAYQIACQTTPVPMLAALIQDAGSDYDICSDIVKDLGCCFQSYKQYMQYGTPASIKALDDVQQSCTGKGAHGEDGMAR